MAGDVPSSISSGKYVRQIIVSAPGPQGPAGTSGTSASDVVALVAYTHNQMVPSNLWEITHNLNFYPNITVFDSAGTMVEGSETHINATTLTIAFSASISGKAHLS
jgi:hypothetical protein